MSFFAMLTHFYQPNLPKPLPFLPIRQKLGLISPYLLLGLIVCALFSTTTLFAQSLTEAQIAKKHMVQGDYKNAVKYYSKAHKKDPKSDELRYQLALAHYRQGKFSEAIKHLQSIVQQPNEKLEYYRLLANSYDLEGDYSQSVQALERAIKQFPKEAELYFDWGVIEWLRKKPQAALDKWETGIQLDPNYADNYFWAAKVYADSSEPLWALLYGEIFMNIERNGGERFNEMGKLVLNTYLQLMNDSLQTPEILLKRIKENSFEKGHYQLHARLQRSKPTSGLRRGQIESVIHFRQQFLDLWAQGFSSSYPTPLYGYHEELLTSGHFEAYNYWLFNQANIRDYNLWIQTFEGKKGFQNFMSWYLTHPMRLHTQNYLVRMEYLEE